MCNHYPDQGTRYFQDLRRPLWSPQSPHLPPRVTDPSVPFAPRIGASVRCVHFVSGFVLTELSMRAIHQLHVSSICSFPLLSSISFLMCRDFLIYSVTDGHWSCFRLGVITNEVPVTGTVYLFGGCECSSLLSIHPGMTWRLFLFSFSVAVAKQFFKVVLQSYVPATARHGRTVCNTSCPVPETVGPFNVGPAGRCGASSHCGFNLHFSYD